MGLYALAAFLLLTTTLASSELVGTDVHLEYYYARLAWLNGWDASLPHAVNGALSITWLVPTLARVFSCDPVYIFKIVLPLLYAFLPVIMFRVYRHFLSDGLAALAAVFIIIVPIFTVEMTQVGRWMVGELAIAGLLWAFVAPLRQRFKYPAIFGFLCLCCLSHYTTGLWALSLVGLLGAYALARRRARDAVLLLVTVVVASSLAWGYFGNVSSGWIGTHITNVALNRSVDQPAESSPANPATPTAPEISVTTQEIVAAAGSLGDGHRGELFSAALGLDFMEVDGWSKGFRVVQIITDLMLILGALALLRRRDIPWQAKGLLVFSLLLLGVAVLIPRVGAAMGISRLYHLVLLTAAPAFAYGARVLLRRPVLIGAFVGLYFFATSGLLFHMIGYDDIETYRLPYSVALENRRLDVGNYLTRDDDRLARVVADNEHIRPVYGDMGAVVKLQNYLSMWEALPLPRTGFLTPGTYYVFYREWNRQQGTLAYWRGAGLRAQIDEPAFVPGIYQQGDTRVAIRELATRGDAQLLEITVTRQ